MDAKRKIRVKRDWSVVFDEFQQSDMSIKEFCQTKGMSQSLFYRRRKDYCDADKSASSQARPHCSGMISLNSSGHCHRLPGRLLPLSLVVRSNCRLAMIVIKNYYG